jgi:hypothetical protein
MEENQNSEVGMRNAECGMIERHFTDFANEQIVISLYVPVSEAGYQFSPFRNPLSDFI